MSEPALQSVPTFDKFEIVKTGLIDLPAHSANQENVITTAHNLGYTPFIFVTFKNSFNGQETPLPMMLSYTITGANMTIQNFTYAYANETNLYVTLANAGFSGPASTTYGFRYYLLRARGKSS